MNRTKFETTPWCPSILALVVACSGGASHDDAESPVVTCEPNEDTFVGLYNAEVDWWQSGSCDEIYVCASNDAAQMLIEQLGAQCMAMIGPQGCNAEGELKCMLATEVYELTDQQVADACAALSMPGVEEVFCAFG